MARKFRAQLLVFEVLGVALTMGPIAAAQFETRATVSIGGCQAACAAIGDFNGDGNLDLVVVYNSVQLLLGRGDGTFGSPTNVLNAPANSVVAGDFNRDGKLDLAVADFSSGVSVLLGNGDGSFQPAVTYQTTCGAPLFIATGDFNGDRKPDLLVTYGSANCLLASVFLGNGDGTFQTGPVNSSLAYVPQAIGVGDFNQDGKLDFVAAEQFGGTGQVQVMLANGDGTFAPGQSYVVGASPDSITVADFRNSGKLDVAVGCLLGKTNVLLGNGDGTFSSAGTENTNSATALSSADFNRDGKPDLAVLQLSKPAGVQVFFGKGDGTFQVPTFFPAGQSDFSITAGDFNNDKQTDIIVLNSVNASAITLLNTGQASFSPTSPINYAFQLVGTSSPPQSLTVTNTAASPMKISSIQTNVPFAQTNDCGHSLAADSTCTIRITFKPTIIGTSEGLLTISDSASSKPEVVELSGAGTIVSLAPLQLNFGDEQVGTDSPSKPVILTNTGGTALTVTGFQMQTRDYFETDTCKGQAIAPGASCTINITFVPQKAGSRPGEMQIYDDGGASPQFVRLTGTGT